MLRLGNVPIDSPLVLAPMAGVTDRHFRLILRRIGGVGLVTMEFISSRGADARRRADLDLMHFCPGGAADLDPDLRLATRTRMAEAARIVEAIGADICDINMGCPANKVLKGCAGCALMGDLDLAEPISPTVRAAIRIPLTVKFRARPRDDRQNFLELGRICEGEGVDGVALHARTASRCSAGRADWGQIARLKEALSIPVIGNGDVDAPADALRMLAETGCDGVMIGRAVDQESVDLPAGRRPPRGPRAAGGRRSRDAPRSHPRALPPGRSARGRRIRDAQAAQVHRLVHPRRARTAASSASAQRAPDVPAFLAAVEEFFDEMTAAAA